MIEDRGSYSCRAANAAGESQKDFALDVLIPPTISLLDRDKRRAIIENGTLFLDCPASGNPDPRISWYKDGQKLTSQNVGSIISGAKFIGSALRIDGIKQESGSGRYTCEATNEAGSVDADVIVEVMSRSSFVKL